MFSFLSSVWKIIVCPFVLFLLIIVLPVLLRFTASDYPLIFSSYSCVVVGSFERTYQITYPFGPQNICKIYTVMNLVYIYA